MPAVTADLATVPVVTTPVDARDRKVSTITTAPTGVEGEGFPVRRAFAGIDLAALDPFIHMDQMGEIDYAPGEPKGTPWHPHRGFETVTYMIDGTFLHQDSHGGGGVIENGATQWMTAGKGILHIETPPESLVMSGGLFHGVQLWVNLPAKDKMIDPKYQGLAGSDVVLVGSPDGSTLVRLIAGKLGDHQGPGSTHTPITLAHLTIESRGRVTLPWPTDYNSLAYVLSGSGAVGTQAAPITTGQLAVFGEGDAITLQSSQSRLLDVLLLGGRPIREPVAAHGPFVMNTQAELQQAVDDFNAGRLGTIPADGIQPFRRN